MTHFSFGRGGEQLARETAAACRLPRSRGKDATRWRASALPPGGPATYTAVFTPGLGAHAAASPAQPLARGAHCRLSTRKQWRGAYPGPPRRPAAYLVCMLLTSFGSVMTMPSTSGAATTCSGGAEGAGSGTGSGQAPARSRVLALAHLAAQPRRWREARSEVEHVLRERVGRDGTKARAHVGARPR